MLPDPHRLLFYAYGGEADNPLRIRQLENNVTRAFINTVARVGSRPVSTHVVTEWRNLLTASVHASGPTLMGSAHERI